MRTRAARLAAHGEPLVIDEVELPEPDKGQLVVEMAYAGVNPVDRYQVLGRVAADAALPRTVGSEGSGTVASPSGGARRVFVNRDALVREGDGLWASHALVRADKLVDVPDGVGLEMAAAMGVAGVTAWRCVTELAKVTPSDRVLVLGASGGVGSIAVSIAHHLGAEVVAQTGSARKADFVGGRGADRVVVAEANTLLDQLAGFVPTVVLDPLGDGYTGAAVEALAPRGRLVLFGTSADGSGTLPLQALYRKAVTILGYGGLIEPEERIRQGVHDCLEALAAGRLEIVIDDVVALGAVNEALERLATRGVEGKLVLDLHE
ncbi:MAG TPA: zinc-binding alcohol dehydrogenase family protein [Acidimicrobiales bacterium]|nr:zinc-binding alcohol dehydrogenase family protein [Acidimicrobiales bacterium]